MTAQVVAVLIGLAVIAVWAVIGRALCEVAGYGLPQRRTTPATDSAPPHGDADGHDAESRSP